MANKLDGSYTKEEKQQIHDQLRLTRQQLESEMNKSEITLSETLFQYTGAGFSLGFAVSIAAALFRSPSPFRLSHLWTFRRPDFLFLSTNIGATVGAFRYVSLVSYISFLF